MLNSALVDAKKMLAKLPEKTNLSKEIPSDFIINSTFSHTIKIGEYQTFWLLYLYSNFRECTRSRLCKHFTTENALGSNSCPCYSSNTVTNLPGVFL